MLKICILGSGSSAVAAAWGVIDALDSGELGTAPVSMTVIDYSTGESDALRSDESTSSNPTGKLSSVDIFSIPRHFNVSSKLFGKFAGSAAFGGLANGWGGTLQAYPHSYVKLWGPMAEDLELNISQVQARLESFHLKLNSRPTNRPARVLAGVHSVPRIKKIPLSIRENNGPIKTPSRLAISPFSKDPIDGCIQCGRCLGGCEWGHIWSPVSEWRRIFDQYPEFVHEEGEWIEALSEEDGGVSVKSIKASGQEVWRRFDITFVALGPIQTAALMVRSGIAHNSSASIRDSQMLVFPFVLRGFQKTGSGKSTRITLSDVFLHSNSNAESIESDWFVQLYGSSEDLNNALLNKVGILKLVPRVIRERVLDRVGFAMAFLSGARSGQIEIRPGNKNNLEIIPHAAREIQRSIRGLRQELRNLGYFPIPFLEKKIPVGLGYHFGSSFPLKSGTISKGMNTSDFFGRPNETKRVHLVDASVLPAISSRPITLTTMANAFRIARAAILTP